MHNWPSNPPPSIRPLKLLKEGDSSNVAEIIMNSHTGTHIDAPSHMLCNGKAIDQLSFEILIGRSQVISIDNDILITRGELETKYDCGIERVLFKTKNSFRWRENSFFPDYVYLDPNAAKFLVSNNVKLVGIDYLSVDKYGAKTYESHKMLFERDVIIVEGINLAAVPAGYYDLFAFPLKIKGADGAPARVLLKAI